MQKQSCLSLCAVILLGYATSAHCMEQRSASDTNTHRTVPLWMAPHQPGKMAKAWNWLRSFIYPAVDVSRFENYPNTFFNDEVLQSVVSETAAIESKIARKTWSLHRAITLLSTLGLGASAYISKYCRPIMKPADRLKAVGALAGVCAATPLILAANNWWNQRFVRRFISEMKNSRQVTRDLADNVKPTFEGFPNKAQREKILNAMTSEPKMERSLAVY